MADKESEYVAAFARCFEAKKEIRKLQDKLNALVGGAEVGANLLEAHAFDPITYVEALKLLLVTFIYERNTIHDLWSEIAEEHKHAIRSPAKLMAAKCSGDGRKKEA